MKILKSIACLLFIFFLSCKKDNLELAFTTHEALKKELFNDEASQEITFTLTNDTVLIGSKGTRILLQKDIFENYLGGLITLELKEFYTREDIILNGLSTISDQQELLETSGMFYINFKENGNQLEIKKDKFYTVETTQNIKLESKIFHVEDEDSFAWTLQKENEIYVIMDDVVLNKQYKLLSSNSVLGGGYHKEVLLREFNDVKMRDSIFLDSIHKKEEDLIALMNISDDIFGFRVSRLGWINIDLILKDIEEKEVIIEAINRDIDYLSVLVIYFDYNSTYNFFIENLNEGTKFMYKPIGKGKLLFIYKENDKILYDKFYFGAQNESSIHLDLKEILLEDLKKEMITR